MTTRQLYILMFLLMALWLILQRSAVVFIKVTHNTRQEYLRKGYDLQEEHKRQGEYPYRVGLTLGGGGVKAFCHAGVLKAMEEEHFCPEVISGVSAGAVIGALYADGYSPDSILSLFERISYTDFFRFEMPQGGLFSLTGFKEFLDTALRAKTFEELKIPLKVIATDIDRGKSVVFQNGNLVDALVATCSVPILFNPYDIEGTNYVDGGVLENLPASAIRSECAYLVGVSVGPMKADSYEKSIANIALRSYKFIFRSNANFDKELCDMLVEPSAISEYDGGDVDCAREIFNMGYNEAKKMIRERKQEKESSKKEKQK